MNECRTNEYGCELSIHHCSSGLEIAAYDKGAASERVSLLFRNLRAVSSTTESCGERWQTKRTLPVPSAARTESPAAHRSLASPENPPAPAFPRLPPPFSNTALWRGRSSPERSMQSLRLSSARR